MNELAVSHYLHDLTADVGQHFEAVAATVSELIRVGEHSPSPNLGSVRSSMHVTCSHPGNTIRTEPCDARAPSPSRGGYLVLRCHGNDYTDYGRSVWRNGECCEWAVGLFAHFQCCFGGQHAVGYAMEEDDLVSRLLLLSLEVSF
jgi:hypothetical protein